MSGLAGFGTGVVVIGIWLYALPPAMVATLAGICSVLSQAQAIPAIWHAIDRRRIWPMLMAGLLGAPVGTWLLVRINPAAFHIAMGVLLLSFSIFMLFGRSQTRLVWGGRTADSAVGFLGGILGGMAGLSGQLTTMRGGPARPGQGRAAGGLPGVQSDDPGRHDRLPRRVRVADAGAWPACACGPAGHGRRFLDWRANLSADQRPGVS